MGSSSSHEIYNDVKKIVKKTLVVGLIIIAAAVVASLSVIINDHFKLKQRESEILDKALPFTSSHKPWVYTRDDFGKDSKLELWLIGDTDRHAIIRVDGKYSVYSTSTDNYGGINFYNQAGSACDYASAQSSNGEITYVTCNNRSYSGGPWNNYK